MNTEETRQEFEKFIQQKADKVKYRLQDYLFDRSPEDGRYLTAWVDMAWMGWKKAIETYSLNY